MASLINVFIYSHNLVTFPLCFFWDRLVTVCSWPRCSFSQELKKINKIKHKSEHTLQNSRCLKFEQVHWNIFPQFAPFLAPKLWPSTVKLEHFLWHFFSLWLDDLNLVGSTRWDCRAQPSEQRSLFSDSHSIACSDKTSSRTIIADTWKVQRLSSWGLKTCRLWRKAEVLAWMCRRQPRTGMGKPWLGAQFAAH